VSLPPLFLTMIRVFGWLALLGRSEASKDAGYCVMRSRCCGGTSSARSRTGLTGQS
jgi:hypothetical protein